MTIEEKAKTYDEALKVGKNYYKQVNKVTKRMEKNFCQTHHLFYYGQECPLCRQERTQRYVKTFGHVPTEDKINKKEEPDREATAEDFNLIIRNNTTKQLVRIVD